MPLHFIRLHLSLILLKMNIAKIQAQSKSMLPQEEVVFDSLVINTYLILAHSFRIPALVTTNSQHLEIAIILELARS